MPTDPMPSPKNGRAALALGLTVIGIGILGVDVVIGFPSLVVVLADPRSHEAQDAGMTAFFLLIPVAVVGIAFLVLGLLVRPTRAGGAAVATAAAVVLLIAGNLGGLPLLILAIGVAIGGTLLTAWLAYRDLLEPAPTS